jgi:hypothetical protein
MRTYNHLEFAFLCFLAVAWKEGGEPVWRLVPDLLLPGWVVIVIMHALGDSIVSDANLSALALVACIVLILLYGRARVSKQGEWIQTRATVSIACSVVLAVQLVTTFQREMQVSVAKWAILQVLMAAGLMLLFIPLLASIAVVRNPAYGGAIAAWLVGMTYEYFNWPPWSPDEPTSSTDPLMALVIVLPQLAMFFACGYAVSCGLGGPSPRHWLPRACCCRQQHPYAQVDGNDDGSHTVGGGDETFAITADVHPTSSSGTFASKHEPMSTSV